MKPFEITHWGKIIQVTRVKTNIYQLYYDTELIASITQRVDNNRLHWTSLTLDDSEANLLGSLITAELF